MNEKLRKHVEILFAAAPKNQRTAEIKEELLNNLNEKYDDLLRNGYDSTAAFHIALSGIGDIDELFGTSSFNSPPSEGCPKGGVVGNYQPVLHFHQTTPASPKEGNYLYPPPQKSRLLFYFALAIALPPIGIGCAAFIPLLGVFLMFLSFGISAGLFVYVMGSLLLKLFAGDSQTDYYQKMALTQAASSGMSQEFVQNELQQIGRVNRMRQIVLGLLIVFLLCAFVLPAVGFAFKERKVNGIHVAPPWAAQNEWGWHKGNWNWWGQNKMSIRPTGPIIQEDRTVGDFTKIHISSIGSVEFKQSDRNAVSIETHDDLLPYLETKVKEGTLFFGQQSGISTSNIKKLNVTVYSKNVPTEVTASGASRLHCDMPLTVDKISFHCHGASHINFKNIDSIAWDIYASGASSMDIGGKAETVTADISGASIVSVGIIEKDLSASADGASRLEYRGTPAIKKQDISGAAKIQGKGE